MYKATVNNTTHTISLTGENVVSINGENIPFNKTAVDTNTYHILYKGKSYVAVIEKVDTETNSVLLNISGKRHTVNVKRPIDIVLEGMGLSGASAKKAQNLKAPMPGLVLKTLVAEGDSVEPNQPLLVLEAMKMENIIKATASATVKKINITPGQAVEKNQVLIEFA